MKSRTKNKLLSLLLTVVMLFSMLPLTVMAEGTENGGTTGVISAIAALAEEVVTQNVSAGTAQSALTLPDTLNATVDGAVDSVTGVTWQSTPTYDADTAGTYVFTAAIPGEYTVEDSVESPVITVKISGDTEEEQDEYAISFTIAEEALYLTEGVPVTEACLLAGVGATDENSDTVDVTVTNTGGLDMENPARPEGPVYPAMPYTITCAAKHPVTGEVFTATREVYVTVGAIMPLTTAGDFEITGDTGYSYTGNVLTITGSGTYTISMKSGVTTTTTDTIVVSGGVTANITLSGVSIDVSGTNNACAFEVTGSSAVNLTLSGTNTLQSGTNRAGMQVSSGNTLTITEASTGTLDSTGGNYSAGIGGGYNGTGGTITISGGTVNAKGGSNYGAGIGGGYSGACGEITINGGTVNAAGGSSAAGIGGGSGDLGGGSITITGGDVTAKGGTSGGAGIGGGLMGSNGNTIIINGGTVSATGGAAGGAGIGGGQQQVSSVNVGSVTINGGDITATGGSSAAGIGGGYAGNAAHAVTINGGAITSTGGNSAPGIGGGAGNGTRTATSDVVINGGTVYAKRGSLFSGNDIGRGSSASGGSVTIMGGSINTANRTITPAPTNGTDAVYLNTLTVGDPAVGAGTAVTSCTVSGLSYTYGINNVNMDTNSKVYFWLPQNDGTTAAASVLVEANGDTYAAAWARTGTSETKTMLKSPYTITFNSNSGTSVNGQSIAFGDKVTEPANPTKTGYTFGGWYMDDGTFNNVWDFGSDTVSGPMTLYAKWTDTTAPTGEIKVESNAFTSFLNTITFGLFFKNAANVEITGTDNESGVATIEYIKTDTAMTQTQLVSATWTTGSSFSVQPNETFIVYARITDNAGNSIIIISDGIVVYTDSEAFVDGGSFSKASTDDLGVPVIMNGNTVKSIVSGSYTLIEGTDYTVDYTTDGTITFINACLKNLADGTQSFIVTWYPLGETGTALTGSDTPGITTITIFAVDFTTLDKAIADAGALEKSCYTGTTWDALQAALAAGRTVRSTANITQAEADAAAKAINDAISALINEYKFTTEFGTFTGSGDLTGKVDAPYAKFVKLLIDGKEVNSANYTVTEGSTVIMLKEAYLKTLSNGTYTVTAEFTDGSAMTTLTVKLSDASDEGSNSTSNNTSNTTSNTTSSKSSPSTGDSSMIWLWIALLGASGLGISGIALTRKRKLSGWKRK